MQKTFNNFGLSKKLVLNLKEQGFITATEVQEQTIEPFLDGSDIIACAKTGSGKTAAYLIPIIEMLSKEKDSCALVVSPTRELAQQISQVFISLSKDFNIKPALLTGGKMMQAQLRRLKQNPRFISGTPGRINDHISRKTFPLDKIKYVVWDETDRMLELGFFEQIENILNKLPKEKQSFMLSATFNKRVIKLASQYLIEPKIISVSKGNEVPTLIKQEIVDTTGSYKLVALEKILKEVKDRVLIFCATHASTREVCNYLRKKDMLVRFINGALKQKQRDKTLKDFKQGDFNILCATDLAARGLDIDDISLVINYELPLHAQEYIHRIGRTGRFNKKGKAITLLSKADKPLWKEIKTFLETNKEQEQKSFDLKENFKQDKDFTFIKKQVKQVKKEEVKKEVLPKRTKEKTKILPTENLPKQEQTKTDNSWGFKKVYVGKPLKIKKETSKKASSKNKFYGKKNFNKKRRK